MTLLIKTIKSVEKVSKYIVTSITARPIRLAVLLVIMSVSTLTTAVILYVRAGFTAYQNSNKYTYVINFFFFIFH